MIAEHFPHFPARDGAGYTVRRLDRRYVVVHIPPGGDAVQGAARTVAGPFESRHAAVAAALGCARRGAGEK